MRRRLVMFALAHKLHTISERWAQRRVARRVTSAVSGIICATPGGMPRLTNQATMSRTRDSRRPHL
jgi:hypothetical protein